MPTRAGWSLMGGGLLTVVAGRLFGVIELFVIGAAAITALPIAVVVVRVRPVRLRVTRQVTPRRVHAGETARVELTVANRSRLRMPGVVLHDPVSSTHGARLQLAALPARTSVRAAYTLPTSRRGEMIVGPLEVIRSDILGLARRSLAAAGATPVIVLPSWHAVGVPGASADHGPLGRHLRMRALARGGDELRGLRDYVPGDDLRRISWKASARSDELKVREHEAAGTRDLTVVLDLDGAAHSAESFERAVTAAASIVVSAADHGRDVRFVTTGGFEAPPGSTGVEALLEHLAVVQPQRGAVPPPVIGRLGSRLAGGLLVFIGGRYGPGLLSTLRATPSIDAVVAVACHAPPPPVTAGVFVVDATVDGAFVPAWNLLVGATPAGGAVEHRAARPRARIVLGEAGA